MILFGDGLRHLSSAPSVAGRLPVPRVWQRECLDDGKEPAPMRNLSTADIVDRRCGPGFSLQEVGFLRGNERSPSKLLPRVPALCCSSSGG